MIRISEEVQGFEDKNTPPFYIVRVFLFILSVQWEYPLELGLGLGPFCSHGMKDKWKYTAFVKIVIIRLKPKYTWIKYCRCDTISYKDHTDSPGSKPGHPNWENARTIGGLLTVRSVPNITCAYRSFLRVMFMERWNYSSIEQTADCLDSCGLSGVNRQC